MKLESRSIKIEAIVVSYNDLIRIVRLIHSKYQESIDDKKHARFSVELNCAGGISYESDDLDLLEEGGPIEYQIVNSIHVVYSDYAQERRIDLNLRRDGYNCRLIVRGDDSTWVNGTFNQLVDIIRSFKPQENFLLRHSEFLLHFLALAVGSSIILILDFTLYSWIRLFENPSESLLKTREFFRTYPFASILFDLFVRWLMGISTFALPIRRWLLELWPSVEFSFGQDHLKVEKNRRQRIAFVLGVLVLPILINLISEWISAAIK